MARSEYRLSMLQLLYHLKRAPVMEGQLERFLGSSYVSGQCHSTHDLQPSDRIFIPLKCFVLTLVIVAIFFWQQFNSDSENFFLGFEQSFRFETALASKTELDEVTGSSVLASLARESALSRSLRCQHVVQCCNTSTTNKVL
ncbi:uncharacterized protein TNCV_2866071 [Trichonephila clavipes]|nr:uncharacterized protein TNCV_2866071 [Trichonephila clavipes]